MTQASGFLSLCQIKNMKRCYDDNAYCDRKWTNSTNLLENIFGINRYSYKSPNSENKDPRESRLKKSLMLEALTEANTRTSVRKDIQKIQQLMVDFENTVNTKNTPIQTCNELQCHLLLYLFYGQVIWIFDKHLGWEN